MNRFRKNDLNYDASPEPTSDPTFDLRRGLFALLIFISIMVGLSLICAWLR
ncbi:MAG TPA: hypothetical protein VFP05_08120 [Thermomicrobiales bacterium]|nr:hypothetical protein [Thermomicrobiales bacterium]